MLIPRALKPCAGCLAGFALFMTAAPQTALASNGNNTQAAAFVIFYGTLKISQYQALHAASDYYEAIGMSQQAQQYLRLADDFQKGTLGGEDGIKTFTQANVNLANDIYELQAAGALPNAQQLQLAKRAEGEFSTAKLAMAAAIVSGIVAATQGNGNLFEKILITATLTTQAAHVNGALDNVSKAAEAYRTFELGGANGFQVVSKEALPAFAQL